MNLLDETKEILQENGKNFSDILWCGSEEFGYFSVDKFIELAKNTNYSESYGRQEIAEDLLLVGENFWLSRGEYDGSEWWNFNIKPNKPKKEINPCKLYDSNFVGWNTLKGLNKRGITDGEVLK